MTKEEQKARKFILATAKRLKVKMGLGLWKIDVEYLSAIENELPNCATVAQCTPIWQYLTATIEINMKEFCLLTEEEQERVLIHELCHVLVAEMREEAGELTSRKAYDPKAGRIVKAYRKTE